MTVVRQGAEILVLFVIAVIVLRSFVLEGYLISTGSMAPGLRGFHRQVHCPSCGFDFPFGVAFDDSVDHGAGRIQEPEGLRRYATCPNCSQHNIDVSGVPNAHGDQLLVLKHAYDLKRPERWETVVFRNPASPDEAYVKRVTGLPGETIRIAGGDIFIDGIRARKSLQQQMDLRIPVCDLGHLAESDSWQMPWDPDESWTVENGILTSRAEVTESSEENRSPGISDTRWIRFRYWRWFGGHHPAETPLSKNDARVDWKSFQDRFSILPVAWTSRVEYDEEREVLRCEGVMPDDLQKDLLKGATNENFRRAVFRLAALSHLAPVTDRYGYNSMVSSPEYVVSDLMLEATLELAHEAEAVCIQIPLDTEVFTLTIDPTISKVILTDGAKIECASGQYTPSRSEAGREVLHLVVSTFDRQICAAINEEQCIAPFLHDDRPKPESNPFLEASVSPVGRRGMDPDRVADIALREEQQRRWGLGVRGPAVQVRELRMFRDVFYTPGRRRHAVDQDFEIPKNCYFVQGDNSPVSSDSRNWASPCVPHALLIGKPFLVHLPSKPGVIHFAGRDWSIRIPDWSRIRYIR